MPIIESETKIHTPNNLDILALKVWGKATSQPQRERVMEVGKDEIITFAKETLVRIRELEEASNTRLLERITIQDINDMTAIWCPSAPGTWFKPWKYDRYNKTSYTKWWDKDQILISITISDAIGRLRAGFSPVSNISRKSQNQATRLSPKIIYNGRPDENAAIREAIDQDGFRSYYLKNNIHLIDTGRGEKYNSLDQARSFRLPDRDAEHGDRIGIVIRPGQAVRMLHFLNQPKNHFPEGVSVKIFPVKTGVEGIPHHHVQEACGLLYYHFSSGDAAKNPYPYQF